MDVEIKIDSAYVEPKAIIITDKVTERINAVVSRLSDTNNQ